MRKNGGEESGKRLGRRERLLRRPLRDDVETQNTNNFTNRYKFLEAERREKDSATYVTNDVLAI